jgi:metallo-beta-lactamase superfamily protein
MVTRQWAGPWATFSLSLTALFCANLAMAADANIARVTILYDAFGKSSRMEKDWGYSAFVEYGGKRILFDTGNNPEILEKNARSKGVDLKHLDFVVLSHRHGDHILRSGWIRVGNHDEACYRPPRQRCLPRGRLKRESGAVAFDLFRSCPAAVIGSTGVKGTGLHGSYGKPTPQIASNHAHREPEDLPLPSRLNARRTATSSRGRSGRK